MIQDLKKVPFGQSHSKHPRKPISFWQKASFFLFVTPGGFGENLGMLNLTSDKTRCRKRKYPYKSSKENYMTSLKTTLKTFILVVGTVLAGTAASTGAETNKLFFELHPIATKSVTSLTQGAQKLQKSYVDFLQDDKKGSKLSSILDTPYKKALGAAVLAGAYALSKMTRAAWRDHRNLDGIDKVKAIINDLSDNGLGQVVRAAQHSASFKSALSTIASDLVINSTKSALVSLASLSSLSFEA